MNSENAPIESEEKTQVKAPSFDIQDVLQHAWEKVSGSKKAYWGALLIVCAAALVLGILEGILVGTDGKGFVANVFAIVHYVINCLFSAGSILLAYRWARGEEIKSLMILEVLDRCVPIVMASILMAIFIFVGFLLFILPGIYLSVCYLFTLPLIVDKGMGPWEAMETSRKLVTSRWFSYFFTLVAMVVIGLLSAIPLGVGLIWTVPMGYNVLGKLYTDAFDNG